MLSTTSSLCPRNECQWSVNFYRPSILENQGAMPPPQWSTMVLLATCLGKYAYDKIVTMSQNEHQLSVNDLCAGILDNLTGMEHGYTTMILSTAFMGKNASDDISSASYNSAPTVHQGSKHHTAINCIMLFPNGVLRGQSLQSVLVFNFSNMHAMSYWSDYFPCSCRVNIEKPAVGFTLMTFSVVSRVGIPSIPIATAMSHIKSLNPSLLKVMISFKN